ncbi:MAG: cbb3-type cytochrome c oxidase subunit I [Pseudorhodobacter sp.]
MTAFLGAGLYFPPLVTGNDPKYQLLGMNFLFISLILIVVASFAGQWAAVHRFIENLTVNFWFGHQGYEYVDLGRFWQIYLTIGLILWATLVIRAVVPVLREKVNRSMAWLFMIAVLGVALLYAPGLMWGQYSHISVMEYWRWWLAHLWLEGIFEVFTAVIVSIMFVRMNILRLSTATVMVLFATIIFLFGGVLGTFHHLYFSGTPTSAIALGGMISALEVVPLLVVGFVAYSRRQIEHTEEWEATYEGPFMFFAAVLFWNLVGAGIFGFLVNTPIALYYIQGLNTTANHAHGALFGVYGMLALGLILFCSRGLTDVTLWNRKLLMI